MEIKREGVRVYRGRRRERWDDWELTNMWRAVNLEKYSEGIVDLCF